MPETVCPFQIENLCRAAFANLSMLGVRMADVEFLFMSVQ